VASPAVASTAVDVVGAHATRDFVRRRDGSFRTFLALAALFLRNSSTFSQVGPEELEGEQDALGGQPPDPAALGVVDSLVGPVLDEAVHFLDRVPRRVA
jgi:hypothetical protein